MTTRASFRLAIFSVVTPCAALVLGAVTACPAHAAERHGLANVAHAGSGNDFSIPLGRSAAHGMQTFKGLELQRPKTAPPPEPPPDLPIFVNPLKRKHVADLPAAPATPVETAERP